MASTTISPSVIKVFHDIHDHIRKYYDLQADKQTPAIAKFEELKAKNALLRNINYEDYVIYWAELAYQSVWQKINSRRAYTATQLWHQLYHHPLTTMVQSNELAKFINYSYFPKVIELGKLNGETPCRLAPRHGLLKESEDLFGNLSYAPVSAYAVSYAEGHPSEEEISLVVPRDDTVLRRFREIGNIIIRTELGDWQMTGHVMVMDLDRDRHPWLILAKTWETDEDEPRTFTAPDTVERNDDAALGVLPGNNNRTTIARLNTLHQSSAQSKPFLLQFGADFEFGLERSGKEVTRAERHSQQGPSLAKIMTWFQRPNGQQVCFDEQGIEYMTRHPSTGAYSYPYPNAEVFRQQAGSFVSEPQYIPLSARVGASGGPRAGPSDSRRRSGPGTSSAWY
ncbi:MAG: hypothetical protein Q9172_000514 [Xanthocarpia lactea]